MEFKKCKDKYFVIVEGEERAAIRKSEAAAEKSVKIWKSTVVEKKF